LIPKSILIIQLDFYILLCMAQQHIGQLKDEIYFLLHLQQHGLQHCCSIASNAG
jgi:hypothetical protein